MNNKLVRKTEAETSRVRYRAVSTEEANHARALVWCAAVLPLATFRACSASCSCAIAIARRLVGSVTVPSLLSFRLVSTFCIVVLALRMTSFSPSSVADRLCLMCANSSVVGAVVFAGFCTGGRHGECHQVCGLHSVHCVSLRGSFGALRGLQEGRPVEEGLRALGW